VANTPEFGIEPVGGFGTAELDIKLVVVGGFGRAEFDSKLVAELDRKPADDFGRADNKCDGNWLEAGGLEEGRRGDAFNWLGRGS
jgi:hypothetical protein